MSESEFVWVRRQWNDYRSAKVRRSDLERLRWSWSSGGIQAPTPQPFVHGYMYCDKIVEGELAHSCRHGEGPHYIKVCVVKKDNDKATWEQILLVVGPKPK